MTNSNSRAENGRLNQRIVAGTDGASFFLYHPQDLQHRLTSPHAWPFYHFAFRPESAAGRLVVFSTGGDGGYAFRITDGPLTEREQKWLASSWDFPYQVRHGRVYLDGGYALPSDNYFDDSERNLAQWISLPNGNYKVTVHAIEWHSEPGALDEDEQPTDSALASYVIQFTPIQSLSAVPVHDTPPRMECDRKWQAQADPSFAEPDEFDGKNDELEASYVFLVGEKDTPVPGFHLSVQGGDELYEAFYGARGNQMLPDRIKSLVIAPTDQTPGVGVLVTPSGASRSNNDPWVFSFHAKRLVNITEVTKAKPRATCSVTSLERPASVVSPEKLAELKAAFAAYAASNVTYRKAVANPDFEADRVASMESPVGLTHVLIHHVQLPLAERLELLRLSDAERVERLLKALSR